MKFRETEIFSKWLTGLRDIRAKACILRRLARATAGNVGDVAPVGEGVTEMRIDEGAGYRVYYGREGDVIYILLCGGYKKSQPRDIATAKRLWADIKRSVSK